jgi:dihydroneopterin aldolase
MTLTVELVGLEVFGYHGVREEERRDGQPFLFDVRLELRHEPAADTIDETVDYREVAAAVREVSDANRFRLLETLAGAVAEQLVERFAVARASVRVRKPSVVLGDALDYAAVTCELEPRTSS